MYRSGGEEDLRVGFFYLGTYVGVYHAGSKTISGWSGDR